MKNYQTIFKEKLQKNGKILNIQLNIIKKGTGKNLDKILYINQI